MGVTLYNWEETLLLSSITTAVCGGHGGDTSVVILNSRSWGQNKSYFAKRDLGQYGFHVRAPVMFPLQFHLLTCAIYNKRHFRRD